MKVLVCLALCVCAVFADGGYSNKNHGGYIDLKDAYKGCYSVGQYLPHPTDECMFLRCDYGNEPWKDAYGTIKLFAREMRCANYLSVGYGYKGGYDNPCQTVNKKCYVAPKKTYKKVDPKPVHKSYDNQGYDKPSYDNKGYDNQGYDNSYGYDNKGYDNQGYDNKGYDNKGYDNKGYDNKGYDNKGYDSYDQGYDKNTGYDNKKTTYEQHSYGYNNRQGYNSGYDKKGY